MAVKTFTTSGQHLLGSALQWLWTLANGDTGTPVPISDALGPWLASVISGTLGAAGSVTWQGSVDGGTTWFTLNDDAGAALTMTALNTNKLVKERPFLVRPNCTAGDGTTSLLCSLITRR
jgi:hypothetical protein